MNSIPISAPSGLAGSSVGGTNIVLTWNPIASSPENGYSPITGYNIYWNGGSGALFNLHSTSILPTKSIPSLTLGTPYRFRVSAVNINGEGP